MKKQDKKMSEINIQRLKNIETRKVPLVAFTRQGKAIRFKNVKVLPLAINLQSSIIIKTLLSTQTLNPVLLTQLGAVAITANKGRVFSSAGNPKDWGIEQETESERQLSVSEEVGPVQEVKKAGEAHLTKGTLA